MVLTGVIMVTSWFKEEQMILALKVKPQPIHQFYVEKMVLSAENSFFLFKKTKTKIYLR